jgi:hypothetical protein
VRDAFTLFVSVCFEDGWDDTAMNVYDEIEESRQ